MALLCVVPYFFIGMPASLQSEFFPTPAEQKPRSDHLRTSCHYCQLHWPPCWREYSTLSADRFLVRIGARGDQMRQTKGTSSRVQRFAISGLLLVGLLTVGISSAFSREKNETIEASAMGTGTQMGADIGVTLNIYEFSTPADRQVLVQAFQKGQNQ